MKNQTRPIIPVKTAITAFIDSGYKSTASAVSEIIDNSIEAKANNIEIIVFEEMGDGNNRAIKKISKIAIVDDGIGMDENILATSLQFGNGTRLNSRKGMGRFGIGLPNSSISQCNLVEVYTWRKAKTLHTYLDVKELEKTEQQNINEITQKELPQAIKKKINHLGKTGTAVVWSDCIRLDIARAETLYNRMSKDLCRIYRYFLTNEDTYGRKINMTYKIADKNKLEKLKPNDPLYLMKNSSTPGYEKQAVMKLRTEVSSPREGKIEIKITDPLTGKPKLENVLFRFSSIKHEIYTVERDRTSKFMSNLKRNMGLSFVRAGREIDFGTFDYFDPSLATERWWGCEIRFAPILDEIFGVPNNKQQVKNMNALDNIRNDLGITSEEIESSPKLKLRSEITKRFDKFKKDYMGRLALSVRHSRTKGKRSLTIADKIFKNQRTITHSKIIGKGKTETQKTKEWRERIKKTLENAGQTLTNKQIEELIKFNKSLDISIDYGSWEGNQFFTLEITGQTAVVKINQNHPFFEMMYEPLQEAQDTEGVEQIDLLLMAWTRVQDELEVTDLKKEDFFKIRDRWGQHLFDLLNELKKIN